MLSLMEADLETPMLLLELDSKMKPVKLMSGKYSRKYQEYIEEQMGKLLKKDIIEESNFPWSAQIVLVGREGKQRIFPDYSDMINKT